MKTGNPDYDRLTALSQEIMRRAMAEEDTRQIVDFGLEQLSKFYSGAQTESTLLWEPSLDLAQEVYDQDQAYEESDETKPTWPWDSWNEMIDPLSPGMLGVLGGGDGMGKTIYAESLAEHWAKTGLNVTFIHFELNRHIMMRRRSARNTRFSLREMRGKERLSETSQKMRAAREEMTQWPGTVTYEHTPGWSMDAVVAQLRKNKQAGLCDIAVIDYLEKAQPSRRQVQLFGQNPWQREADNVERVKDFAEALEVPVIMLAQLNKANKTNGQDKLDRTAMRGAGEKSEKSNLVVLIQRQRMGDGYDNIVDVIIDKNTLGRTGRLRQVMVPEHFFVSEVEVEHLNENIKPLTEAQKRLIGEM